MVERDRPGWVDMGGVQRLADRVLRSTTVPAAGSWWDPARPVLAAHWPLADHDWHRRRAWAADGVEHEETDHQLTRYALLPDGRLVRALTWRSEARRSDAAAGASPAGVWQGEVRTLVARDVRLLDQRTASASTSRGGTTTWGEQPTGEEDAPWPGAGIERLLKALIA